MRRFREFTLYVVALLLSSAPIGCSVKRVPNRDPATRPAPQEPPAPYDFEAERQTPPPEVKPEPASATLAPENETLGVPTADLGSPAVAVQDLPAPARPTTSEPPRAAPPAQGYRVQVFASTDRTAAERVQYEIESRLGHRAYLEHQPPYYKVRVGNCRQSEACRELQESLRRAGYESIWVVESPIEP